MTTRFDREPEQLALFEGAPVPRGGDRPAGATFGQVDGKDVYRYDLRRIWGEPGFRVVNFIMLNPSTADATKNDPTITRCVDFARRWGFGGLTVTNLFALRSTDPKKLRKAADPVGPLNDEFLLRWALSADRVVCAWGAHLWALRRGKEVLARLRAAGVVPHLIGFPTKGGHPPHPLYLPGYARLQPMEP
jgi:hypothetical protein